MCECDCLSMCECGIHKLVHTSFGFIQYTFVVVWSQTYMHMHKYTHTYTSMYACTHTHTHTQTHTSNDNGSMSQLIYLLATPQTHDEKLNEGMMGEKLEINSH